MGIKVKNEKYHGGGFLSLSSRTIYDDEYTCDVCGYKKTYTSDYTSYDDGLDGHLWKEDETDFQSCEIGEFNKRIIYFCKSHKDHEIRKRVKQLI